MSLRDIHGSVIRTSSWIFLVLATISGYMSYRGALTINDDVIIAVCYAVAVACVIYLLATFNTIIIPTLSHQNRQGMAWLAYLLSMLTAILISSYTNLAGIAGDAVIILDARHHVEKTQDVLSRTSLSVKTAQNTITSLMAERSRFLTLAEKERKFGTLSGSRGTGVITNAYIQAAGIIESSIEALASKKDDLEQLVIEGNSLLEEMRRIFEEDTAIGEKTTALTSLNRRLQNAYEDLAATNLKQVIENSLGSLDNVVAISKSRNSSLRTIQQEVIKRIREDFAETKLRYTADNGSMGQDIPEYPVWEPRFQTRLLLAYAADIIPYIVAAMAIDCGVFILVLLLIALQNEIRDSETELQAEGRKYTVRELNETQAFLNSLESKVD